MLLSHLEALACVIVYPSCCFSVHVLVLSLLLKKKKQVWDLLGLMLLHSWYSSLCFYIYI